MKVRRDKKNNNNKRKNCAIKYANRKLYTGNITEISRKLFEL